MSEKTQREFELRIENQKKTIQRLEDLDFRRRLQLDACLEAMVLMKKLIQELEERQTGE